MESLWLLSKKFEYLTLQSVVKDFYHGFCIRHSSHAKRRQREEPQLLGVLETEEGGNEFSGRKVVTKESTSPGEPGTLGACLGAMMKSEVLEVGSAARCEQQILRKKVIEGTKWSEGGESKEESGQRKKVAEEGK